MTQLNEEEMQLVEMISRSCRTPADVTSKLKNLFAGTLQKMLEAEMDEHLGYEKNSVLGNNSGNSRNGYSKKTIKSEWGESEIAVPRDRAGTFEPQVIEKRQTRTDDMEARILAMYQKGMSVRDIEDHVWDIYGVDASASLINCLDNYSIYTVRATLPSNKDSFMCSKTTPIGLGVVCFIYSFRLLLILLKLIYHQKYHYF